MSLPLQSMPNFDGTGTWTCSGVSKCATTGDLFFSGDFLRFAPAPPGAEKSESESELDESKSEFELAVLLSLPPPLLLPLL